MVPTTSEHVAVSDGPLRAPLRMSTARTVHVVVDVALLRPGPSVLVRRTCHGLVLARLHTAEASSGSRDRVIIGAASYPHTYLFSFIIIITIINYLIYLYTYFTFRRYYNYILYPE